MKRRRKETKKERETHLDNLFVRAINDSHRSWVKKGLVKPSKELAIDWETPLSGVAKAEVLAATFHVLSDHLPEVWKKVPAWLRAQIKQAMFDCAVDYKDLSNKDIDACMQYGKWLNLKHPAPKSTHCQTLSNLPKRR